MFLQFEDEPFRLEWKHVSIVIITPTRAFLNERPWVTWEFQAEVAAEGSGLMDLYRRPLDTKNDRDTKNERDTKNDVDTKSDRDTKSNPESILVRNHGGMAARP
jgi:hypothetical protein